MLCLCGALDCSRCHPENFRRGIYIAEMDKDEIQEALDSANAQAEDAALCREDDDYESKW